MIKRFTKKLFINICRLLDFEIIDQNQFTSPTLSKSLDENLSKINKKSIVLPLGEVKIKRKINSLNIIFRSNTKVNIWDQNKKRIFDKPRIEYTLRSLNSLLNSLEIAKSKFSNINMKLTIVDDNSDKIFLEKINSLLNKKSIDFNILSLNKDEFKKIIIEFDNTETFSNLASLFKCFSIAKDQAEDLIFFLEDDYLHKTSMLEEMLMTYERLSSQLNSEVILCPSDYPYLYSTNRKTNVLLGSHRHWQLIDRTLCTFLTSKIILNKYWDNFVNTCKKRNDPFEKYLNEIYNKEYCFSPIQSLSIHCANVNSSYGMAPYTDIKKLWDLNRT
tara:strand:- start:23 stop:1015 length:993 start_codon:yes stop_codon:yes gene_type:complete